LATWKKIVDKSKSTIAFTLSFLLLALVRTTRYRFVIEAVLRQQEVHQLPLYTWSEEKKPAGAMTGKKGGYWLGDRGEAFRCLGLVN
jgi:hypothetical protein